MCDLSLPAKVEVARATVALRRRGENIHGGERGRKGPREKGKKGWESEREGESKRANGRGREGVR